jgi:uncharacterized phage protein (TIGR01671 family)
MKMREILFRGKDADSGLWCYGDLSFSRDRKPYIRFWAHNGYLVREVMPETVGQFTGFVDKNKKRIFEDDILASTYEEENVVHELVLWYNNGWHIKWKQAEPDVIWQQDMDRYSEIVGNIWDNPELLEVE